MTVVILVQRYFLGYNIPAEKKILGTCKTAGGLCRAQTANVYALCFASIMRCPP